MSTTSVLGLFTGLGGGPLVGRLLSGFTRERFDQREVVTTLTRKALICGGFFIVCNWYNFDRHTCSRTTNVNQRCLVQELSFEIVYINISQNNFQFFNLVGVTSHLTVINLFSLIVSDIYFIYLFSTEEIHKQRVIPVLVCNTKPLTEPI